MHSFAGPTLFCVHSTLTNSIFPVTPSFFKENKHYPHSLCLNEKARLRETKVLFTFKACLRRKGPDSPTQSRPHAPGHAQPPGDSSGDPGGPGARAWPRRPSPLPSLGLRKWYFSFLFSLEQG